MPSVDASHHAEERARWGLVENQIGGLLLVSGLSLTALARRLGVPYQTAFRLIHHQVDSITPTTLAQICAVFGVDVDAILSYDPPDDLRTGPSQLIVPRVLADLNRPAASVRSTLPDVLAAYRQVYPRDPLSYEWLGRVAGVNADRVADLAKNRSPRLDYVLLGRLIAFFSRAASKRHPGGKQLAALLEAAGRPLCSPGLLLTVRPN